MAKVYKGIQELIGNTPLVEAVNLEKKLGLKATLLLKLEYFNPAGSVKDRIANGMIEDAEKKGLLKEGATIIEPTSGNTGIGLAAIAAAKGYKAIFTMPETMSVERRNILKAYGAEIVLTPGEKGMSGAIAKAEELAKEIPGSFIPGQFVNPANPATHKATTGPEIWNDTEGKVDIFLAGVGTGGTVTGIGEYLKEQNPDVKVIAIEPATSPVLSQGHGGAHKIQGIGAGFVPDVLNTKIYDEVFPVENEKAFEYGKELAKAEGIITGISSGAALYAAIEVAKRPEFKGKTVAVSGFGNVAWGATMKATELGAKVVCISGPDGYIYDENGVSTQEKFDYMCELRNSGNDVVEPYAKKFGAQFFAGKKPWEHKVDIALPCAIQNELNLEDAKKLVANGVTIVAEVSNMGCTAEAAEYFVEKRLIFAPGKAVNCGGVSCSCLEMSQNAAHIYWSEAEVDERLHQIMKDIHTQCVEYGKEPDGYINYVKGANIAGFMKVAKAMVGQGVC